ncbi:MAG TPA: hypothetical protein VGK26_08595 [Thermoanaerobaculia bacterium]
MQGRSRATIGLLLPLLVAIVSELLRLQLLRARPLWFDELFTFWAARLPLQGPSGLLDALRFDSGPPGFYLLEKPFALLADRFAESNGDAWLRTPSFLAGLGLLWGMRTLTSGISRALFVILVSGSTLLNLYAAEARAYAALAALALALFLLALRGAETGRRLAATAVVAALALYTHYLALFVVAALLLLAAQARRWRSCAGLLVGTVVFLPWLPILRAQPAAAVAWIREPAAASSVGVLSALGGVGRVPGAFGTLPWSVLYAGGVAVGAACLVLLLLAARRERDAAQSAAFVLLVLGGVAAAGLFRPILFPGRTELAVLPVWVWGIASASRGGRALRAAGGVAAALGLVATVALARQPHPLSPLSAVTESLARAAEPGDSVLAAGSFYLPARLASERRQLAADVSALPVELAKHPGWFVPALPGRSEEELLASTLAGVPPGSRLFLVLPAPYQTEGMNRVLADAGGQVRPLIRSRDAAVTLWAPRHPAIP